MPKVLYLFDALKRGGAETSTLEIAKRFNSWVPVIVSLYQGTELKEEFEREGIKVYSLDISKKFGFFQALKGVKNIINIEKPDIIHANLFMAEQISRWIGPSNKIPIINSFVNDSYSKERYELLNSFQRVKLDFYKNIDKFSSGRVTKFMSLTKAIVNTNSIALGIDPTSVRVIPRGRDINSMKKKIDPAIVRSIKEEYGQGPIILTVSRLLKRKGYLEAIRAINDVLKKYPQVKYLIAGQGHDELAFRNLIKELGLEKNIFLLGNRKDVPSLLMASDIFLFPSHYEGQGGALIEAMVMGKKIIATRIPVLEESVGDGFSAKLFEYRNPKDMTEKIFWAIENPEKMQILADKAQEVAEERFNINVVTQKHEELYLEVLQSYKSER